MEMSVLKCPYCFARCKNIHVPKCSGAEISRAHMSMVPKIPCAKMYPCRKVFVSKRPWRRNVHVPVLLQAQNITECHGVEISLLKCLLLKYQVPKWWEAFLALVHAIPSWMVWSEIDCRVHVACCSSCPKGP
jgi:hypothetical protein